MDERKKFQGPAVEGPTVALPVVLVRLESIRKVARQKLSGHGQRFVAQRDEQRGTRRQEFVDDSWPLVSNGADDELVGRRSIGQLMQGQTMGGGERVVPAGHGFALGASPSVDVEERERIGQPHPVTVEPQRSQDLVLHSPA